MIANVQTLSTLKLRPKITDGLDLSHGLAALPRGGITEILGEPTTGRTAVAQWMLATATRGGEVCAVIDTPNAFDPASAMKSGTDLGKLLWVQCSHNLETALKAADMILHNGGFGLVLLDLCDVAPAAFHRVPTSCWYRFRLAIEPTPTVLLILARQSVAKSCATRQFKLEYQNVQWEGAAPFQTIDRLDTRASSQKPTHHAGVGLHVFANTFAAI